MAAGRVKPSRRAAVRVIPELTDLPFGPAHLEIRKRLLRLIERKYLVDHGPNAPYLEKLADLCELATVWIHQQE